MTIFYF
jgi:nuclear protein localization family protein 4